MERFTVTQTFNGGGGGGLSPRLIFEQNEPSIPITTLPPKTHLIDTSFSSCIRAGEPKLLAEERFRRQHDDSELRIFDAEKYFNEGGDQKEKKQPSTVAVSLDRIPDRSSLSTVSRLSSVSSVDGHGRNYKTGSFHATPTASSEASWNSRFGLLSMPPGSIAVSMRNLSSDGKKNGISRKWLFRTRCPCTGKKSVQVENKLSNPKSPSYSNGTNRSSNPNKQSTNTAEAAPDRGVSVSKENSKVVVDKNMVIDARAGVKSAPGNHLPSKSLPPESSHRIVSSAGKLVTEAGGGGGFSFPILNPPLLLPNGGKMAIQLEDPPSRESLEVFRPSDESMIRKSTELQRQLLMQSFTFPASPKTRATTGDDDVASDTSSDLFEIESFSTQTTMYPLNHQQREALHEFSLNERRRNYGSIDGSVTPSTAPTEIYEPSEVSIDWSVTTAEGFDRRSVATSDYEDFRFKVQKEESEKTIINASTAGNSRRKGNGLLSCRCEKAVSVGPHPVRQLGAGAGVGVGVDAPVTLRLGNLSSMHKARHQVSHR